MEHAPEGDLFDEGDNTETENFMNIHPHVCDRTYMHMQDFKVCSGLDGDRNVRNWHYKLMDIGHGGTNGAWALGQWRATSIPANASNTYWMRTTIPGRNERVTIASIFESEEFSEQQRGAFSFLGGDAANKNYSTYAGAVGNSKAQFFKCITGALCGVPSYTYHGNTVYRLKPGMNGMDPFMLITPDDVEACGSIGYKSNIAHIHGDECIMDLALFPHV